MKRNMKIYQNFPSNSSDIKWFIIVFVLIIIYLILQIPPKSQENNNTENYTVEINGNSQTNKADEEAKVTFKESDDNTDYSYIINPSALSSYNIGAERIQHIPDELNRALLKENIKGAQLEIQSVKKKGTLLCFKVKVLEHGLYLDVEYNERIGTISIK